MRLIGILIYILWRCENHVITPTEKPMEFHKFFSVCGIAEVPLGKILLSWAGLCITLIRVVIASWLQWNWCQFQPANAVNTPIKADETWDDLHMYSTVNAFIALDTIGLSTWWCGWNWLFSITMKAISFSKCSCWIWKIQDLCGKQRKDFRLFFVELLNRTREIQKIFWCGSREFDW